MQPASQKAREALEAALKHVEHTCKVSGFFSSEDSTGTPGPMPKEVTNYYIELRDQIAAALAAISEPIGDGDGERQRLEQRIADLEWAIARMQPCGVRHLASGEIVRVVSNAEELFKLRALLHPSEQTA